MNKRLLTLFLLISGIAYLAGIKAEKYAYPEMTGKIGNYPVVMQLYGDTNSSALTGWYYYKSQGSKNKISLRGNLRNSKASLTETVNGKTTGSFSGNLGCTGHGTYYQYNFYGNWTSSKGKVLFFDLEGYEVYGK